jgi:polynucleotide 5'-hydroxyl-kinase GRC3/NOL9
MGDYGVPDAWPELLPKLQAGPPIVLVIGPTDSGKSTFCRWLAESSAEAGHAAWVVDADVGQSSLGPPATIGCGAIERGRLVVTASFFVGDVSPGPSPAAYLGAFALALRAAEAARAERIIVDSTGWVSGPEAVALKLAKGALLGSAHVVLIERGSELRAFRRAWRGAEAFPVHQLAPAAAVKPRSANERRAFREGAFRAALSGAVECEIDLRQVGISGAPELGDPFPNPPPGLLVGLNDGAGRLISLGILLAVDARAGRATCLAQPEGAEAAEVRVGRIFLNPDGTHSPVLPGPRGNGT